MKTVNGIPGWFDYEWLYDLAVEKADPNRTNIFVECGALFGASSMYLAKKIAESGKDIRLYVVDTFDDIWGVLRPDAMPYIKEHGGFRRAFDYFTRHFTSYPFVHVYQEHSLAFAKRWADLKIAPLDFVFLDSDHTYENVVREIGTYLQIMRDKGSIAGHDYSGNQPGVVSAVRELLPEHVYKDNCWIWGELGVDLPGSNKYKTE